MYYTNAQFQRQESAEGILWTVVDKYTGRNGYIPGALHIERDASKNIYKTDADAAAAVMSWGISPEMVSGILGVADNVYALTQENLHIIYAWLSKPLPDVSEQVSQTNIF